MLYLALLLNSVSIGVAYAMDAFSVSLTNGLNDPKMKRNRMALIALVFAGFQFAMPFIGWVCVNTITNVFSGFEKFIPWIALALLGYIGGKMLIEGIGCNCEEGEDGDCAQKLTIGTLLIQGIATSIDALSGGFAIKDYNVIETLISCTVIAVVTFIICCGGVVIGKKFGTKLAGKASILGGVILLAIGIKIFVEGVFLK